MITIEDLEKVKKITYLPWQREVIESKDPLIVLCCGRKSGKTEALEAKITLDMMNSSFTNTDGICILSNGQRTAKELLLRVLALMQALGVVWSKDFHERDTNYASMTMLRYKGNKLHALPCGFDGSKVRYFSFYKMYRDEDAFIPNAVDAAVQSCLSVHGVQEIRASTPNGTTGSFFDSWHSPLAKRFHTTSIQAPHVSRMWLHYMKQRLTKSEWDQEIMAKFTDIADGIYARGLIGRCTLKELNWKEIQEKALCLYLGADFAGFGDDKNVIAFNYYDGVNSYIKVEVLHTKERTTQIARRLSYFMKDPKFTILTTDYGGLGEGPTDILVEEFGERRIIGIKNQVRRENKAGRKQYMKVHLHNHLIKLMETGRVFFEDDMEIVRSLTGMKVSYGKTHKLTITGRDSHAAEAIVRAVFPLLIGRKPLPPGSSPFYFQKHKEDYGYKNENSIDIDAPGREGERQEYWH